MLDQRLSLVAEELEKKVEVLMRKRSEVRYVPRPPSEVQVDVRVRPDVLGAEAVKKRTGRRVEGSCIELNGVNSYVEIPSSQALEQSCDTLKVDLWVQFTSPAPMTLIDCLFEFIKLTLTISNGSLSVTAEEGVERGGCGSIAHSTKRINDGKWHSIHIEWQPTWTLKIDGRKQPLTVHPIQPVIRSRSSRGSEVMVIGGSIVNQRSLNEQRNSFKGCIAEIRLWGATPRGMGVIAKYSCDDGQGTTLPNLIDKRSPATLNNITWSNKCAFPDTVLELGGNGYVTGGTLGITTLARFSVTVSLCTSSTKKMSVLGVTDSQKKHQHLKLVLNCNEEEQHEADCIFLSVCDTAGRVHSAVCSADVCDAKWNTICWTLGEEEMTLTINGEEYLVNNMVMQQPREYLPLMDFLPLGAHNNRGTICDLYEGLVYDCRITSGGEDVVHWMLGEGPGQTLLADSTNNAKHAVYRSVTQSVFVEKSSASSAIHAFVDKHSALWHPYPRPGTAKGAHVLIPNAMKISLCSRSMSVRPPQSPYISRRVRQSFRSGQAPDGTAYLRREVNNLCMRSGVARAVETTLGLIDKVAPMMQTASAALKWCANASYCAGVEVCHPEPEYPVVPTQRFMSVVEGMKEWYTPKGLQFSVAKVNALKHDIEVLVKVRGEGMEPLYLMTSQLTEMVTWGVWVKGEWVSLECWEYLEAAWESGSLLKAVPEPFTQELAARGDTSETKSFYAEKPAEGSPPGFSFYSTDSLLTVFRYSNTDLSMLSACAAWVYDPEHKNTIPSEVLEIIYAHTHDTPLQIDDWKCTPVTSNSVESLLEECSTVGGNPMEVSHHLTARFEKILEEGIPVQGVSSDLLKAVTDTHGNGYSAREIVDKLALQRLEYKGARYMLSLSGIPHVVKEESGEGGRVWRVAKICHTQTNSTVNTTLQHAFRGFYQSVVHAESVQITGEFTTPHPTEWYACHTVTEPVVFDLTTAHGGDEQDPDATLHHADGAWRLTTSTGSTKTKATFDLRGWLYSKVRMVIPHIDNALERLPMTPSPSLIYAALPTAWRGAVGSVTQWRGYYLGGTEPSAGGSILSAGLQHDTMKFIGASSRVPRVWSWCTGLSTAWVVCPRNGNLSTMEADEITLRELSRLEEFEMYLRRIIARPGSDLDLLDQLLHLTKRVVVAKAQAHQKDVMEQLTWCLKDALTFSRPLIRTDEGPFIVRWLIDLGCNSDVLDIMLRHKWGDGGNMPPLEYLDDLMLLVKCGAKHAINGEVLHFIEPFVEYTPLHLTATHGRAAYVPILVEDFQIPINAKDQHSRTALHLAVTNGNYKTAGALLTHGADTSLTDFEGRIPLHLVARPTYETVQEALNFVFELASMSDPSKKDSHNLTPLDLVEETGTFPALAALLTTVMDNQEEEGVEW